MLRTDLHVASQGHKKGRQSEEVSLDSKADLGHVMTRLGNTLLQALQCCMRLGVQRLQQVQQVQQRSLLR